MAMGAYNKESIYYGMDGFASHEVFFLDSRDAGVGYLFVDGLIRLLPGWGEVPMGYYIVLTETIILVGSWRDHRMAPCVLCVGYLGPIVEEVQKVVVAGSVHNWGWEHLSFDLAAIHKICGLQDHLVSLFDAELFCGEINLV